MFGQAVADHFVGGAFDWQGGSVLALFLLLVVLFLTADHYPSSCAQEEARHECGSPAARSVPTRSPRPRRPAAATSQLLPRTAGAR